MVPAVKVAFLALALMCYQVSDHANVRFELRLAEKMPAEGLVEAIIENSREKVYLRREAVVTNEDLVDAWVVQGLTQTSFDIHIVFGQEGSDKMAKTTQENIGKHIAILIDGKVVAAPTVRSAISDRAVISGSFTREEAERIAAGIKRK